jgi:hypothetical protein
MQTSAVDDWERRSVKGGAMGNQRYSDRDAADGWAIPKR